MPQAIANKDKIPALSGSVRVNISTAVNKATIRHEKRNGRDVIVVPSATLPDDVVMNGIKYPAAEIAKSFHTLDRTFAPLGHPMVNNNYVSAQDPEAINGYHVGAHNENVRRENGRVFLDKVIDVEVANRTEHGRALIDAINKGEPIETSTGVLLDLIESTDPAFSYIASNMYFDHDAILIGEEGAARPSQGVGMMVNKSGDQKEITVINSYLDCYENDVEWAAKNLFDSVDRLDKAKRSQSFVDKIMSLLKGIGLTPEASGLNTNHDNPEDNTMAVTEEQFNALAEQVKELKTNAEKIKSDVSEAVQAAIKPLTDSLAEIQTNAAAASEAERTALTEKVVTNDLLDADDCKGMTVNALRKLADKVKPGAAAPIVNGVFKPSAGEDYIANDYNPNAAIDAALGAK